MKNSSNDRPEENWERFGLKHPIAVTILNSLSAHMAILDHNGVILAINKAWRQFAETNGTDPDFDWVGVNYLAVCDSTMGEDEKNAEKAAKGIRSVIRGRTDEFLFDYPCHTDTEKHWFYMRVLPLAGRTPVQVVVSHEEITALKLAQESLMESQKKLEEQKQELSETNIALKVLLRQREKDQEQMEQKILDNMKELVFPYLEKLRKSDLKKKEKALLDIIQNHLSDILSPFLKRLSSLNTILTPQEMQVATLIKDGRASKEIADMLNISLSTVNFHRKNLRAKFDISNKPINLRTFLLSLE